MKRVVVHIERLVLRGFGEADRGELAQGLQETLAAELGQRGVAQRLSAPREVPRVDAGTVRIARGSRASRIGGDVAKAIVKGITT